MDISKWPLHQIMQLPDHSFGRRWPIAIAEVVAVAATVYDISTAGLPEVCVVWGYWIRGLVANYAPVSCELRLGDQLPANAAEFNAMEPLFREIVGPMEAPSKLYSNAVGGGDLIPIRMPVAAGGRRMVAQLENAGALITRVQVGIVVSSVPREVPDCLLLV